MEFIGNYIISDPLRNVKGHTGTEVIRGLCTRCLSKYTATDSRTLVDALSRHVCDPFKHPEMVWLSGGPL